MYLLKRGTLPWLEREALETYGDAGYLGVIGDMVDEMDIPSSGDPGWQILRPERVVGFQSSSGDDPWTALR